MAKQPVHEIRFGLIKAQIWQNRTAAGERYNVTLVRVYRNGDHWVESHHFGRDDLPLAAKAADLAHSWIFTASQGQPGGMEAPAAVNGAE